jgi:hypothetical protein
MFNQTEITYLPANSGITSRDRDITRYPTYTDVSVDNPNSRPREPST